MPDPRNTVSFDEIARHYVGVPIDNSTITFDVTKVGGSASVGLAVTLSANKTVALAADGNEVFGKLIKVEDDGVATIQDGGFMKLPGGTAAALTPGKKIVGALLVAAKGYIREVATATAAELGVAKGEIVDASVTTAVVVKL